LKFIGRLKFFVYPLLESINTQSSGLVPTKKTHERKFSSLDVLYLKSMNSSGLSSLKHKVVYNVKNQEYSLNIVLFGTIFLQF